MMQWKEVGACRWLSYNSRDKSYPELGDVIRKRMDAQSQASEKGLGGEDRTTHSDRSAATAIPAHGNTMNPDSIHRPLLHSDQDVTQEEWLTIYRFPHIVAVRIFSRFKFYQTAATITFALASVKSHLTASTIASNTYIYVTVFSAFTTVALYIVGNVMRRVIGFAYISRDHSRVKLAHMTFWGRRTDRIFDTKFIVPLNESSEYMKFRQLFIADPTFTDKYYLLSMKAFFPKPQVFADTFGVHVPGHEGSDEEQKSGTERAQDEKAKEE